MDILLVEHLRIQKNLIGIDEFNQSYFDKIDQIEADISNEILFEDIIAKNNISSVSVKDFKFSSDKSEIEKRIFELRNISFDIFEKDNDYILYKIDNIQQKKPNLNDDQTKKEIIQLIDQKNKFDYNKDLLDKINNKEFSYDDFKEMGEGIIQTTKLNSIKDNNKFEINSVEILYSLPLNSFTLISDDKSNIFLARIKAFQNEMIDDEKLKEYYNKQNSNIKNTMLGSYDLFLNKKYDVNINQKTMERVKNFFQ